MSNKERKQILKQITEKYPCYTLVKYPDKIILNNFYKEIFKDNKDIIEIMIVPKGNNKLFRFIFNKDIPITIGINKLIKNKSNKENFIKECRNAISSQIKEFYKKEIESGKVKLSKEKLVVDHVYPFSKLIEDYCITYKININTICPKDKEYKECIKNFAKYHKEKAKLQILPYSINAKKSNKV